MSTNEGFLERHHFLLRRLQSLTGIVPIGVFLIMHLTTNSTIAWGGLNSRAHGDGWVSKSIATFQHEVEFINNMPLLLLIEITLWLAIAFHAILGTLYVMGSSNNVSHYKYGGNLRYVLQRWTGVLGLFFILYHVATLRWGWSFLVPGGTTWSHEFASSTLAAAMQGSTEKMTGMGILVSVGYFLGVTALVFHFANGLWTAAITWGLTVSRAAQKRWGFVCAGLGAALMVMAWASVVGFATLDYDKARALETHAGNDEPVIIIEEEVTRADADGHNDG